jgi:hypothetical protein
VDGFRGWRVSADAATSRGRSPPTPNRHTLVQMTTPGEEDKPGTNFSLLSVWTHAGIEPAFDYIGSGFHEREDTKSQRSLDRVQQMREAWPYAAAHRFRCSTTTRNFGNDVASCAKDMGNEPVRTSFPQPVAEPCRGTLGWELSTRLAGPRDRAQ